MRIVYLVTGSAGIVLAVWALVEIIVSQADMWFNCIAAFGAAAGGLSILIAGVKRYRGGWPTIIGVCILYIGIFGFVQELSECMAGTSSDLVLGLILAASFSVAGVLLLYSGQKLHEYSLEIERMSSRPSTSKEIAFDKNEPSILPRKSADSL